MRIRVQAAALLAAAVAFASIGGCSTSAPSDGKQHLTFWHTLTGVNAAAMDKIVQGFNSTVGAAKNIVVESVFQGDDTVEKLKTVSQANDTANFPDVAMIAGPGVPTVMRMKPFVPVQTLVDDKVADTLSISDLEPNVVEAATYQGKLMTMPFNNSTILLYYNRDAFAEVGFDPDKPPTTIAELAEATAKLKKTNGTEVARWGLNVEVRRYHMASFIGGQGTGTYFGNNNGGRSNPMTEVTFGADGTLKAYLNEWQKVVATGAYKPIEDNVNEEFANGLSAMTILSSARIATIGSLVKDKFEWSVAPLPKVNASDTGGAAIGGSSLAVFDRGVGGNVEAAWQFMQYAASPEAQATFHIATGYIPVNVKTYQQADVAANLKKNPKFQVAIDQMHNSSVKVQEPFDVINWEIDAVIREAMRKFGAGGVSVDDTVNAIVTQCNDKLAAYAKANY